MPNIEPPLLFCIFCNHLHLYKPSNIYIYANSFCKLQKVKPVNNEAHNIRLLFFPNCSVKS